MNIKESMQALIEQLQEWLHVSLTFLPNLLLAALIFYISYKISTSLHSWSENHLKKVIKQASIRTLISNAVSILITALGLLLALSVLNLDTLLKSILAGAGVAGLAVGLALQGTLSNTFSGIFLAIKDILNVGDWVESNGFSGRVSDIGLRNTKLIEADNNIVIIPNKMILDNPFKNYGLTNKLRISLACGVAYNSDLEKVKNVCISILKEEFPQDSHEEIEFFYTKFNDSSIDFIVRLWIKATSKLSVLEAKSMTIMKIKSAFEKSNIEIPYPITTILSNTKI